MRMDLWKAENGDIKKTIYYDCIFVCAIRLSKGEWMECPPHFTSSLLVRVWIDWSSESSEWGLESVAKWQEIHQHMMQGRGMDQFRPRGREERREDGRDETRRITTSSPMAKWYWHLEWNDPLNRRRERFRQTVMIREEETFLRLEKEEEGEGTSIRLTTIYWRRREKMWKCALNSKRYFNWDGWTHSIHLVTLSQSGK